MATVTQVPDHVFLLATLRRAHQRHRRARQWTIALRRLRHDYPPAWTTTLMRRVLADLSAFDAETRTLSVEEDEDNEPVQLDFPFGGPHCPRCPSDALPTIDEETNSYSCPDCAATWPIPVDDKDRR